MRGMFAFCFAGWLAIVSSTALAQGDHDAFHSWYQGLRSPEGDSCCNAGDCHPVASRFVRAGREGHWILEIRIDERWVKVPKDRILPQASPDGAVHACYSNPARSMTDSSLGLVIRCVITGGLS